ncbi:RING/U-box superfamily protein [Melia azedarach]|uniref:RING/U-box superfamily protein n=1 Tax=Melia azedarach TaxID=155640 RepID=A0ACC1XJU9_MELAZ|nr:RING/U-box superfamily protein [Melia azedarach]
MSSTTTAIATSTTTTTGIRVTYWCHECDMSVSLLFSSSSPLRVLCPHCQSHFLEHMESNYPNLNTDLNFLFDFTDCDDDNIDPSNSDVSSTTTTLLKSSMNTIEISDSVSQESCAICKDEFSVHSEAKELPCKHLYHSECILTWVSNHSSCPLCRFQLPTATKVSTDNLLDHIPS